MPLRLDQQEWLRGVIAGLTALSDNRWAMPADHLSTILYELAAVVLRQTPGYVVEMGCATCKTSLKLAAFLRLLGEGEGRALHLYDSFEGFPDPTPEDQQKPDWRSREDTYLHYPEGGPEALFQRWGDCLLPPVVHKGFFSDQGSHPDQIAFALIDCDMYAGIKTALKIVWPRLPFNGVVMIHDYGNPTWPGAWKAVSDHFSIESVKAEVGRWELKHEVMLLVSKREPGT